MHEGGGAESSLKNHVGCTKADTFAPVCGGVPKGNCRAVDSGHIET